MKTINKIMLALYIFHTNKIHILQTAASIMEFPFNKKRVRVLSDVKELPEWTDGVIYWTFRDERIHGKLKT